MQDHRFNFHSFGLNVEKALRESHHIVSYDAKERAIWYFRVLPKDGEPDSTANEKLGSTLQILDCALQIREEGVFEPASLHKSRLQTQQSAQTVNSTATPTASIADSQRQGLNSPSQLSVATPQDNDSKTSNLSQQETHSPQITDKLVYENFIGALLSTVSSTFCTRTRALPLNYRTVLLPVAFCQVQDSSNLDLPLQPRLGSFRAYITTTGALIIGFSVTTCRGFESLSQVISSTTNSYSAKVLAAPFGIVKGRDGSPTSDLSIDQSSANEGQVLRNLSGTHLALWEQACFNILQSRGVVNQAVGTDAWATLSISKLRLQETRPDEKRRHDPTPTFSMPWPGKLCFRKKILDVSSTNRVGEMIISAHDESHDPLALAKNWFNASAEREEKLSRRRSDRKTAQAADIHSQDLRSNRPNAPSPLAMRQQGTSGGSIVYPTPPDALLNGVTPTLDGALSSPGNPLSAANVDIDPAPSNSHIINSGEEEAHSENGDTKRLNSDANLLNSADNIFEDIGGDMFDDNDITEADFNFFDEEPSAMETELPEERPMENDVHNTPKLPKLEHDDPVTTAPEPAVAIKDEEVVFAKPELRHARSSQVDETQRTKESFGKTLKRSSSPFDPHTIFKRVRASILLSRAAASQNASNLQRTGKIFEKVDFDHRLPMLNKKYEHGGLYDYGDVGRRTLLKSEPATLPQTNYLKRHGKGPLKRKPRPTSLDSLMGNLGGMEGLAADIGVGKYNNTAGVRDDSSSYSDSDESDRDIGSAPSPLKTGFRSNINGQGDGDAVSQGTPARDAEPLDEPDDRLALELPRLLRPDTPEISLPQYFADPEPFPLDLSLSDEDLILVAQLVTEQAAIGALDIYDRHHEESYDDDAACERPSYFATRGSVDVLQHVVSSYLSKATPLKLKALLDVQDIPLVGQPARVQPRAIPGRDPNADPVRPSNLYQIPSPHLEVKRADSKLSVLPSAISFWESLGLAPSSGSKDINAVCVFQGWTGMADNIRTFLGRLKSMYETLKLGSVQNMPIADQEAGMLQYEVDKISTSPDATMTGHGSAMIESMELLRSALSNLETVDTNVVVYFVYSPRNPGTIVEACTAFQRFFDSYQASLTAKQEIPKNELVLQLISADLISSPSKVIVTPAADLVRLCMETYDRCVPFGGTMPAPAIRLEQPLPRIIDFKLNNNPSASLIRENSCIHVAYATSVDKRWISAAWTDDRGNEQATASYCFGRKDKSPSRTMNDIANEIWESTLQLISTWKIHWRVVITKCGPMEAHEAEFWIELARTEIHASVTMILMTVDTNPSLQLIPPAIKLPPQSITSYTTPVSTPQPNIVSPEAMATPATPARDANALVATPGGDSSAEPDTESVLADVTDQTWGAISNHRLSNSTSTLETHPAFISGYLVKRTGSKVEDAPAIMEVNLVHTEAGSRAYEPLLREMLSYFRSLGTLARARGVVEAETDVRPWHVAAAEKAVRTLYLLM